MERGEKVESRGEKVESRELDSARTRWLRKSTFHFLESTFSFANGLRSPLAKAEDKGFEPSTGFPAPDFESGS